MRRGYTSASRCRRPSRSGSAPPNLCVPGLEPREGRRAAPGMGVNDTRHPAASPDHVREPASRIGAVSVDLPRIARQHRVEHDPVVNIGGRDLDRSHQPAGLVSRNMRLVAVNWLLAAVPGPTRLAITLDAG